MKTLQKTFLGETLQKCSLSETHRSRTTGWIWINRKPFKYTNTRQCKCFRLRKSQENLSGAGGRGRGSAIAAVDDDTESATGNGPLSRSKSIGSLVDGNNKSAAQSDQLNNTAPAGGMLARSRELAKSMGSLNAAVRFLPFFIFCIKKQLFV